jgi:hypothetical protein
MRILQLWPGLILVSVLVMLATAEVSLHATDIQQKNAATLNDPAASGALISKDGLLFSASLGDEAVVLNAPSADAPAALLKTFASSENNTSLIGATASIDPAGTRHSAAPNQRANPVLDTVQAVAIPEPTALFLAGFAGCTLLGLAQRLRASARPGLRR